MTDPSDGRTGEAVQSGQKSADAYRTIGEVADELVVPQHVLRFWETRFPQVKPLKRAGGRRFYRPDDVALLRAVRALLYDEGYTIKGVQRLLAEHGARHVAEALARSRATAAAPAAPPDSPDLPSLPLENGPGRGEAASSPEQRPPTRREAYAAQVPPIPAAPRRPISLPARVSVDTAGSPDVVERIGAVLADLVECANLLASVRSI